ncbi:MAG TPA: hypothetical protein DCQ64_33710 [Candidatus Rokubacteria bacterium]|nr:hypothetical protein [Candidatus Rokubacteria bacterium]
MPDPSVLHRLVRDVTREVRLRRAEFFALRGLFVAAAVAAAPLVLREALGSVALAAAGGLLLLGAGVGAVVGALKRVPETEAARLADRGFDFQDRVATCLEWAERPDRTPLVEALVADTIARVEGRQGRRIIPRLLPREAKLIPVPLVLGLILALAPPIPLPAGGLPNFSAKTEEGQERAQDRYGRLQADERPRAAKREAFPRADLPERNLVPRQGAGGQSQPGDLTAVFKDTSLGSKSPDFNSFLKKGDERIRMLEQVDRLPDLQRDFTQSQHKVVFQRAKALRGGLRPDQVSPEKLRELLNEMERLGRKGGAGNPWNGDIGEGMEALEQGQTDKAMEAMERALSKMRSVEEKGRDGKGLRGGRESDRRGGQRDRGQGQGGPGDEGDFPEGGEGLYPGKGKSPSRKGDPSQRLRANPFDVGVEGESRQGRKEGFDTNLLGRGAHMPSRLRYLGVVGQYRKMMEEAIAREQVPRDFQTQVKQYFQSLDEK